MDRDQALTYCRCLLTLRSVDFYPQIPIKRSVRDKTVHYFEELVEVGIQYDKLYKAVNARCCSQALK